MTTLVPPDVVRRATSWHRPLMIFTGLMAVSAIVSVAGLLLDDRTLTGDAIWLKPFKFSVSLALYALTWAWLLSKQRRQRRWMWWSATTVAVLLTVEMVIIVGQVVRGRISHFNAATELDATLFSIMGTAITVVWVLGMIQGIVLLRERLPDRPLAWAIRAGIVISTVGIGLAFLMTDPTSDQLQAMQHGIELDRIGGHSVGVPDGGPGMPLTGWSTTGGDLRIPHFVGIHALQALPLLAMLLAAASRRVRRLTDTGVRTRIVLVAAGAYAAMTALVTWQALRGQSLIDPDLWTLTALGTILAATGLGVRAALNAQPVRTDTT
jgi:hypothetical protein